MRNIDIFYGKNKNHITFNCIKCGWYGVKEFKDLKRNKILECNECGHKDETYLGEK